MPEIDIMTEALRAMREGKSLQQWLKSQADAHPQIKQALQMIDGKSEDDIWKLNENLARTMGADISQIRAQLGV